MNIQSQVVGSLKSVEYDEDVFVSEPFEFPYFDNTKLKIIFVEAKHQPYLESADSALRKFLALTSKDRIDDTEPVFNYYAQTLAHGYTSDLDIKKASEVWNHVIPNEIIVDWDENGDFYLCVSCGCDWEEEHGLQLVFKNGDVLIRASGHDGHLTD